MIHTFACLIKQEIRLMLKDRVFWVAIVAFALLVIGATRTGLNEQFQRNAALKLTRDSDTKKRELFKRADAGEAGYELAHHVELPIKPLSVLALGQQDLFSDQALISVLWSSLRDAKETIQNPADLATGKLDLSFVVIYVLPLLLVVVCYDIVSNERERGTLALILTQSVDLRTLVNIRIGIRLITVLGLLYGIPLFCLRATVRDTGAEWGLWIGFVAAWSLGWSSLILIINTLRPSSAGNALTLLSLWILTLIISPAVMGILASSLYPVPSRVELVVATREADARATSERKANLAEYLKKIGQTIQESSTTNRDFSWREWIVMMQASDHSTQRVKIQYNKQLDRQSELIESTQLFLPVILLQRSLEELGGTSQSRYVEFEHQADKFNNEWRDFFQSKVFSDSVFGSEGINSLPKFEYDSTRDRLALTSNVQRLLWMLLGTTGFWLIAMRGVSKIRQ